MHLGHPFLFVPPVAVVLLSRLTGLDRVRRWLQRPEPTLGTPFLVGALLSALGTLLVVSAQGVGLELAVTWSLALLLMRDQALPVRVAASALVLLAVPAAWPSAALVLAALAFWLHHGGLRASRLLGADSGRYAAISAIGSSVMLACLNAATHGGPIAQGVLAVSVLCGAVLLDWAPGVAIAIASVGLNLVGLTHGQAPVLTPFAFEAALGAAVLAAALRVPAIAAPFESAWARLGRRVQRELASSVWVGAFALAVVSVAEPSPRWLAVLPLLLLTPNRFEAGLSLLLGALMVVKVLPLEEVGVVFALAGFVLAWAPVFFEKRFDVMRIWHHAGWALSVLALFFCTNLHSPHFAQVWALMALTGWAVAVRAPKLELVGFGGTLAAAHAVLAYFGVTLSSGAPTALILLWFSLGSVLVGSWPLARAHTAGRRIFGVAAAALSVSELLAGVMVLDVPYPREALVGVCAAALAAVVLAYRAMKDDGALEALVAQVAALVGVVTVHHLGLGQPLGPTETGACLVFGFALSELSGRASSRVAATLRLGSFVWPVVGVAALAGQPSAFVSLVLMAVAAHFAVMARSAQARGRAAIAAALAFNAAMVFGYHATEWSGPQYLAIPFGLSMLVLVWVFKQSLDASTAAKLRAVSVTIIYGAAAWSPLTFDASWALWLCVLVCVIGIAGGIALRIRSYVFLGTGFLVTSIVANLVRYGLRDPRAGAIFLSGLGLLVVGFMVLVTTRRAELLARYRSVTQLMARWEG
jgi:hypothetical protein